jgi:hypothetical protein
MWKEHTGADAVTEHSDTAAETLLPPSANPSDSLSKEWAECRSIIARCDTTLEDLRKFGFSLVTILLTASAFFGVSTPSANARVATTLAVMVLIGALFSIDTYYEALKSGAAERALDLEARSVPPIRITKYISRYVQKSKVFYVALGFYLLLMVTASGLGLWAGLSGKAYAATSVVAVLSVALIIYMVAYWLYIRSQTRFDREKSTRNWPPDTAGAESG